MVKLMQNCNVSNSVVTLNLIAPFVLMLKGKSGEFTTFTGTRQGDFQKST